MDGYYSPVMQTTLRDIILQVKENADIVQVIGQYVPLKKVGGRYLGLCPFHHDRSPSLNVTPQMGIYKCFACGAGGDVLKFVQEYEKLDFIDALKAVALRANITIPEHIHLSKEEGDRSKSTLALAANQLACRIYQEELEANTEVLEYISSRGINAESRKHFQMGYAPVTPEKLISRAEAKDIPISAFIEAGILGEGANGRIYDRFAGRLIFPIWNLSGHVVGFGGRVLVAGQQPKYLNSPESPFYHKSKVLYGFNFSRNAIDKAGEAVIVEGYMDMLALWQAGIHNAVAVSGTALTKEHVQILARFASKVYLFLDGDAAGRKAVRRSLEPLVSMGLEVRVPVLPVEEDPDSFTRKNGAEKVKELFAESEDIVGFLLRAEEKPIDAMSPEEKDNFLSESLTLLAAMPSPNVRDGYMQELQKKLGVKNLRMKMPKYSNYANQNPNQSGTSGQGLPGTLAALGSSAAGIGTEKTEMIAVFAGAIPGGRPKDEAFAEWQLLQLFLSSSEACHWGLDQFKLEWLMVDSVRNLVDLVLASFEEKSEENKAFEIKSFMEQLSQDDRDIVSGIRLIENVDLEHLRKHFNGIVLALEIRALKKQMAREKDLQKYAGIVKRLKDLQSKTKGGSP